MSIKLTEYEDFVLKMMSSSSMNSLESKLATAGLGLGGEGGEVADLVKKVLFHEMEFDENVKQKLVKELGDAIFYIAFAARVLCEVGLQEIMDENVNKLNNRYKNGKFTKEEFLLKENAKKW